MARLCRKLQSEIKDKDLRQQIAEFQCPYCGAALSKRVDVPIDQEGDRWSVVETYECGFENLGEEVRHPCPSDPRFPSLDDYDLTCKRTSNQSDCPWRCDALPKTKMARKVSLCPGFGKSEAEAKQKVVATYLYRVGNITHQEWFLTQIRTPSKLSSS